MVRFPSMTLVQRMNQKVNTRRMTNGIFGIALSAAMVWGLMETEKSDDGSETEEDLSYRNSLDDQYLPATNKTPRVSIMTPFQPTRTSLESSQHTNDDEPASQKSNSKTLEFDFVILGNGNAGQSAVETLQKQCPSAKIAIIDPFRPVMVRQRNVEYFPLGAIGFLPQSRTVQVSDPTIQLQYRHGILVATGSRGAPPPPSLFDRDAMERILELRPTERVGNGIRPILPPPLVRQLTLLAASEGATIGFLGSGWDAVELAITAASAGPKAPILTFGSAGPLSHVLPRYLSSAVTKRLQQHGITVRQRTLVRYVSHHKQEPIPRVEMHTAKSNDLMETQRTVVDLLVVAPFVDGPHGTAVMPTSDIPNQLQSMNIGQPWFQTWSQLASSPTSPSMVVCYADDGRIAVNAELSAASRVYAAGSVAKYPSSVTGHGHVAGEGCMDGALAGQVAALHLSRDYHERRSRNSSFTPVTVSFAKESFPVWRSDVCPYLVGQSASATSSLSNVGIRALCVGQCDSNGMATHGYWWTNQSAQRHLRNQSEYSSSTPRRRTRRSRTRSYQSTPVYGTGVVFYLDRSGRIRGIMTWGLPFTSPSPGSNDKELNQALVDRMKEVIRTNGRVAQSGAEQDTTLQSKHLSDESKMLVALALSQKLARRNTASEKRLMVPVEELGSPLHRYTPGKPLSITSFGTLRRTEQLSNRDLLGESLYVKDDDESVGQLRPPTLLYVYPMHSPRQKMQHSEHDPGNSDQEHLMKTLYDNELRARPPKEEPLWLRRGDALKGINAREMMAEAFIANIRSGHFQDGSSGVRHAPMPQAVETAKDMIMQYILWSEKEDDEEEKDDQESDDELEDLSQGVETDGEERKN